MFDRLTRWLQAPPEAKASRAQSAITLYVAGRAVWTPRDYAALSREGFQKNAIVHRAVRLVSEAAAALPSAKWIHFAEKCGKSKTRDDSARVETALVPMTSMM